MHVISTDGTRLAYDRIGSGPALILVDGALCSRSFGPSKKLAQQLASQFTVFTYDRRGRGESGDTPPYAKAREVEDLAALLREAAGSAFVLGTSSGGALALDAAASGLPIEKLVAYEPPFVDANGAGHGAEYEPELKRLIAANDRSGALTYFMQTMVGVPAPFVWMARAMPWVWPKLKKVAHTLPYDAAVMSDFKIPRTRLSTVACPSLIVSGSKTQPRLIEAARMVADVVPGARHRSLEGQTHNVSAAALAPVAADFFAA